MEEFEEEELLDAHAMTKEKQALVAEMLDLLFEQGDISRDELQQAKREGNSR